LNKIGKREAVLQLVQLPTVREHVRHG